MRIPHRIRPNASSALPTRIVLVDTETQGVAVRPNLEEHRLRLFSALYWQRPGNKTPEREEWRRGTDRAQFWEWVERRVTAGKRLLVYAHNAHFDLQALGGVQELARRGWTVTKPVIDSERVILRVERAGSSMLWLDSYNFFPAPLELAAELLGLDYVALPARDADAEEWQRRCDNDVRILRALVGAWLKLVGSNDLGHFSPTLASQALHAYRHRFMEHEILVGSRIERPALERAAYMGARTEAWTVGRLSAGPYTLLDVNSAFAAVMGRELYPRALRYVRRRTSKRDLLQIVERDLAIARVQLTTPLPIYPTHHQERLVFPVGTFVTTLTTPELRDALHRNVIDRVDECAVYDGAPIFAKWVREIYALRIRYREQGRRLEEGLVNAMLKALYGKFGELRRSWVKVADEPELQDEIWTEQDLDAGRERIYRRLGGVVHEREIGEDAYNAFPAIPAHVTAHARLLLWRYAHAAGVEHVHYMDTDSLIVDAAGRAALERYIDPATIGRLKIVDEADVVEIRGPKDYTFGERTRRKGIRPDAELTPEGKYRQREFLGLSAQLRMGHAGGPLVRTVDVGRAEPISPDRLSPEGRVAPLRLTV